MANEPDRDKRERLEQARNALTEEHLQPAPARGGAGRQQGAVRALGATNYRELYERFGFQLDDLGEQCRAFLDETERL